MQKKVFIIIVSYNGEQWIKKNLESLKQSIYPISIIVIDNNSTDNTTSIIKLFSEVQLISSDENLGFGKANNVAIQKALEEGADYIFLLNQDAWVFPETIENLVSVAESNKDLGIISPLHYSGDAQTLDKNFEACWSRKWNAVTEHIDEVPFVNAAAWLIPKSVIRKVGFFDPMFSHYGEDRNYVNRVLFHHYKVVVVKNAKICHDRIIKRSFDKDTVQSKYMILNNLLNINDFLVLAYLKGFHSVLGLSKYMSKFYTFSQTTKLFFVLLWYYIGLKFSVLKIIKTRSSYR